VAGFEFRSGLFFEVEPWSATNAGTVAF